MLKDLPSLERLVRLLQRVPYLASKNIYPVALHFISLDEEGLKKVCDALVQAQKTVKKCSICFNFVEGDIVCSLCTNPSRDKTVVCVVETWHDLLALEKAGGYKGLYHILGGALSPLEGITVDKLTISQLLKRVEGTEVQELIFATNPTPEGEATASYIVSKCNNASLKTSKLASGVPIGSHLQAMDRVTVYKALQNRRPF
jgi:recombination protein RecR